MNLLEEVLKNLTYSEKVPFHIYFIYKDLFVESQRELKILCATDQDVLKNMNYFRDKFRHYLD